MQRGLSPLTLGKDKSKRVQPSPLLKKKNQNPRKAKSSTLNSTQLTHKIKVIITLFHHRPCPKKKLLFSLHSSLFFPLFICPLAVRVCEC